MATAQQGGSDGERGCGVRARGAVGLGGLHAGGFPAGNLGGFPAGSFGGKIVDEKKIARLWTALAKKSWAGHRGSVWKAGWATVEASA